MTCKRADCWSCRRQDVIQGLFERALEGDYAAKRELRDMVEQPEIYDEMMPKTWRPCPDSSAWSLHHMKTKWGTLKCFLGFHRMRAITSEWIGTHIVSTLYRCERCPYSETRKHG